MGARFEEAVEAVIGGDRERLEALLAAEPGLARARSERAHGAQLLHYLGANGVEDERQKTPANAVEIARVLLAAGADANATARLYGGECTMLSLLVSSCHPAQAGLQIALAGVLIDHGARLTPAGEGQWTDPVQTALVFGYRETAAYLVERGAPVATLAVAAGLGRMEQARSLLDGATKAERHAALALAAQTGQAEAVRWLLGAGEDPNRYNPPGFHGHATPLHQAALAGHVETVRALLEGGADRTLRDTMYQGTARDWAEHGGQRAAAELLR